MKGVRLVDLLFYVPLAAFVVLVVGATLFTVLQAVLHSWPAAAAALIAAWVVFAYIYVAANHT